ncbi:hypothetical protein CCACVL1_08832 [Corchorus capsularis]|uniref:TF-B3 domain-containing protein n=1 Tax=Corchorus capsularis TaxID=210143 RepID=A0A1R3IYK7_COCAP|nr:hypothetical protein CCACVL1_08832 [Corchorus capsularis]
MRKILPDIVRLKGPSEKIWYVELSYKGNILFFENGWEKFVRDHCLEVKDVLVLTYLGKSTFNVKIFNESGYEKEALYYIARDSPRDIIQAAGSSKDQPMRMVTNYIEVDSSEDGGDQDAPPHEASSRDLISFHVASPEEFINSHGHSNKILGNTTCAQTEASSARKRRARRTETSLSLRVEMIERHVYGQFRMGLRGSWVKKHLSDVKEVILRYEGKEWEVEIYHHPTIGYGELKTAGWRDFVYENRLRVKDICVFTPVGSFFSSFYFFLYLDIMESNKHGQKWQEEVYWNCFKRQGFFANLPSGFHEQLAIPKKFALKLRNKLPETATLKGPSGLTWSVELTRNGDALFFTNGWAEFVKDISLEENDLLIFRFNGESSFNVWVYDPSNGTEKEALYFPGGSSSRDAAGPSDAQGQPKRRDKAKFVVVKSSSDEDEGNASQGEKSENEDGYYRTPSDKSASDDGDDYYQAAPSRRCATSPSRPKKMARLTRIDTEPVQIRGAKDKSRRRQGKFKIFPKRRLVTEKEKSDTLQAAREASSPDTDSYIVVMRPTMVYYMFRVGIRSDWVKKHLSPEIRDVILRLKDQQKAWTVGYYLVKSRNSGLLTTNWKRFVVENGLEEDDVCVFKPALVLFFVDMGDSSKDRFKWQEDIYWTRFKCQHFCCPLISSDFHEQLAIPQKFVDKLRRKLPETVGLRGPSGYTWFVKLTSNGDSNSLFFSNGWPEFVKDHCLEENDMLTFRFNGESSFDVVIYDPINLCEKENLYFLQGPNKEAANARNHQSKRKIKAPHVKVESSDHQDGNGDRDAYQESQNDDGFKTPSSDESFQAAAHHRSNTQAHSKKFRRETNRGSNGKIGVNLEGLSNKSAVRELKKLETLMAARRGSTLDSEVVVMQPRHVDKPFRVGMRTKWVAKYLSPETLELILRMEGKESLVGFYFHKRNKNGELCNGWKEFAVRNRLKESDVCVFTPGGPSEKGTLILDVSIFRVGVGEAVVPPSLNHDTMTLPLEGLAQPQQKQQED